MNWIGIEELLLIHARVIAATGGAQGVINTGALDSALRRPFTAFDGCHLFPSIIEKVAAMIHSIVAFHPFADGNKRTALVAGDVVLRLNELRLIPSDEVEPFFWSIARGEQDVPQIAAWLQTHTEQFRSSFGDKT
ncbi:MAG: type II toxin-antitoxin system death-on-curing family toxin [Phycisphaerae bacterium]